ncbi:hypothetical protein [Aestuariivirga sp.]|uniref:COG3904 family protein n=1 Tax=Aestuariivirga sp. TaxID=2650926 RepID=UPI0039E2EBA1
MRGWRFWAIVAAVCGGALLSDSEARAAHIFASRDSSTGLWSITLTGEITPGDASRFESATWGVENGIVSLNSEGGTVGDAVLIGQSIRKHGLKSVVARRSKCFSACAIAWLGGIERYIEPGGSVGFHAAYNATRGRPESGVANAIVGAYYAGLGLNYDAVIALTSEPPKRLFYLTKQNTLRLGIAVSFEAPPRGQEIIPRPRQKPDAVLMAAANAAAMDMKTEQDPAVPTENKHLHDIITQKSDLFSPQSKTNLRVPGDPYFWWPSGTYNYGHRETVIILVEPGQMLSTRGEQTYWDIGTTPPAPMEAIRYPALPSVVIDPALPAGDDAMKVIRQWESGETHLGPRAAQTKTFYDQIPPYSVKEIHERLAPGSVKEISDRITP